MRKSSTRLFAAAAVTGLVVLSACGSDSNDADDAVTTDAPAATDAPAEGGDDMDEAGTIVDVAVANGSFETLVAAVTAADLVDTLSSEGPFTVFAPTDDAFAALPDGLVECLLLEENVDALSSILTYHVVSGEVLSTDLTEGAVATVQGEEVVVDLTDGVALERDRQRDHRRRPGQQRCHPRHRRCDRAAEHRRRCLPRDLPRLIS